MYIVGTHSTLFRHTSYIPWDICLAKSRFHEYAWPMHRYIAGYNSYNLLILTIDYSKNFTTNKVLTIEHMSMFVVKSIVIKSMVWRMDLSIF